MDSLKYQSLEIVVETGNPTLIKWLGVSQARDPASVLNPYFGKLAEDLQKGPVIVDFTKMEYMNSSTDSAILAMCRLFEKKGIQATLQYDKSTTWQVASFKALITLSRVMNHIVIE